MKLHRGVEKGSRETKRCKEGGVITSFSVGQMHVFSTFCDIKSLLIIFLFPGVDCRPSSSPIRAVQRSQWRFDRCAALHISQGCTLSLSISPPCWIPLWLRVLYRLRLDVNVHVCLMLWLWPPLIQQCHFSALVSRGDLPHLYTNKFKPLICVRLDEERWRAAHCVENRKGWMDISHRVCVCVVWRRKETGHQSKIRLKYDTWPAALDEREKTVCGRWRTCPFEMALLVRGQQRADRVLGFCVWMCVCLWKMCNSCFTNESCDIWSYLCVCGLRVFSVLEVGGMVGILNKANDMYINTIIIITTT